MLMKNKAKILNITGLNNMDGQMWSLWEYFGPVECTISKNLLRQFKTFKAFNL